MLGGCFVGFVAFLQVCKFCHYFINSPTNQRAQRPVTRFILKIGLTVWLHFCGFAAVAALGVDDFIAIYEAAQKRR